MSNIDRQAPIKVEYKGQRVGESCLDLPVCERVVVELEAVDALAPIHWHQVRSYLANGDEMPLDLTITMNRHGCEKRCPVYKVAIFGDGTSIVVGEHYVKTPVLDDNCRGETSAVTATQAGAITVRRRAFAQGRSATFITPSR